MATENLWGDMSDIKRVETPKTILHEQADILTSETDGLLLGRIDSSAENDSFYHDFDVVVPLLNNYAYTLLRISHGLELYPVTIYGLVWKAGEICQDEDEFKEALRRILSSKEVRRTLSSLLSQIESD